MNVVFLAAALDTVEQDHDLVLDRMRALKEVIAALMSPEDLDAPRIFGRLRELDNFFVTQFVKHMAEEEKTLFPLLEWFPPEGVALAERLRRQHATLRRRLDDLSNCLGVALQLQDRPPRAVPRDLITYAWDFWEMLDNHALEETQGIHECLNRQFQMDER